jgi:hypothetical protein
VGLIWFNRGEGTTKFHNYIIEFKSKYKIQSGETGNQAAEQHYLAGQ